MNNMKTISVYASSSNNLQEIFYSHARTLGKLIGKNGYDLVYGGSRLGLMYACADAARENGSKIYGVMPEKLVKICANPEDCDKFIITEGMRERKAKLDEISDAVIAMAGGFGTLEEISEMIVQKQLGYNNKPIVFLNTAGFYNTLVKFFDEVILKNFAKETSRKLFYVAETPEEAIDYIVNYKPEAVESKHIFK